ncbi:MAG: TonB-dependent receptor [Bacteroidales bacterium]|nr:TonB-dependent receptor [Bacteroidales bacterium]
MKRKLVSAFLSLLALCAVMAQGTGGKATVTGWVVDNEDNSPVIQATVQVLSVKDSSMVAGNVTDTKGHFSIAAKPGRYLLKVSYIGYKPFFKAVSLTRNTPNVNAGKIALSSDAIMLKEAVIVAQAAEVTASEDTLVYNSSAYRVPEGSALEELVKKLPGAEVDESGKITINGKEIKKIMVDGKEFFADDPNIAMKNLPVNIIDKVRAYDKQSDMARMTGIDDGEEETVLDLTVKKGMNRGFFGNVDAAAGTEDRYSGKLLANYFQDKKQFTVIGSMNNVNDESFPGGGGGGRWRRNNGLTSVKMGGFNFATETPKLEASGSVNFNYKDQDVVSKSSSETFVSTDRSSFANALNQNRNKTTKVTADFRIEWKPDSLTNLMFRPRFNYGDKDNATFERSYTFNTDPGLTTDEVLGTEDITSLVPEANVVNSVVRNALSKGDDMTVGGTMLFNRRLGKAGRNLTFRGQFNYTNSSSEQFSASQTDYFQQTANLADAGTQERVQDIIRRYIDTPTKNYSYSARLAYSEPIFKGGYLQLGYNFQYKRSDTDNRTYNMPDEWTVWGPAASAGYGELDTDLSKSAKYDYYNHQVDLTLRYMTKKLRMNAGLSFQPQTTKLSYAQGALDTLVTRHVFNFTPTMDFRYTFSKTSQLRINYRGRSSQPSMTDMLPITDNTDPLNVRVGNPGLKPTFTNSLMMFYNTFNTEKQRGMMAHLNFQNQLNSISNRRIYNETTGGYTTTPVNMNGNWSVFGMVGTNTALNDKRFTINTFTRANYQNQVSYISSKTVTAGNDKNTMKNLSLGERLRGTFRNNWWEFSLNGSIDYGHARNSYNTENNMDTYQFSYGGSTNVNLPWNMTISTDLTQQSRRGYNLSSMNTNELIWNAQIAQNFLKGNAATLSLQFYDILRQQSNISRTISAAMRRDVEYNAIYSYCMVHFVYRLNLFGGKGAQRPSGPGFGPAPGMGPGFGGPGRRPF